MSSIEKNEIMEVYQFTLVGTLTMYTFIDFVAILTNSIFRMRPQDWDEVKSNVSRLSVKCLGDHNLDEDRMADPVWAAVGILILTFPGFFLISQTDGPIKDGFNMVRKFLVTKTT